MAQLKILKKYAQYSWNPAFADKVKAKLDCDGGLVFDVADGSTVLDLGALDSKLGALQIIDVMAVKTGSTGSTTDAVQLCTDSAGSTAISSSLALNTVAAGTLTKTTAITNGALAAGAHLYVKRTHTTDCSCTLVIRVYQTA